MINVLCAALVIVLGVVGWWLKRENSRLRQQNRSLQGELEEAIRKLADYEAKTSSTEDLFEKSVQGLVALGVPGLVLLVALGTTGFAGAAAVTAGLASLGGPFGMLGGIGVLLLLALVSRAIAQFGLSKLVEAVGQGLVSRGNSPRDIVRKIHAIPKWVISANLRCKIERFLE